MSAEYETLERVHEASGGLLPGVRAQVDGVVANAVDSIAQTEAAVCGIFGRDAGVAFVRGVAEALRGRLRAMGEGL